MNSSFGNDPKILKQLGEDGAFVHPTEAVARDCQWCPRKDRQSNRRDHAPAYVSADVPRGVILTHKSRWTANGVASNVNALNPGRKADLAESCAVHSINVSVAPA
jgi:hypothetical protein